MRLLILSHARNKEIYSPLKNLKRFGVETQLLSSNSGEVFYTCPRTHGFGNKKTEQAFKAKRAVRHMLATHRKWTACKDTTHTMCILGVWGRLGSRLGLNSALCKDHTLSLRVDQILHRTPPAREGLFLTRRFFGLFC